MAEIDESLIETGQVLVSLPPNAMKWCKEHRELRAFARKLHRSGFVPVQPPAHMRSPAWDLAEAPTPADIRNWEPGTERVGGSPALPAATCFACPPGVSAKEALAALRDAATKERAAVAVDYNFRLWRPEQSPADDAMYPLGDGPTRATPPKPVFGHTGDWLPRPAMRLPVLKPPVGEPRAVVAIMDDGIIHDEAHPTYASERLWPYVVDPVGKLRKAPTAGRRLGASAYHGTFIASLVLRAANNRHIRVQPISVGRDQLNPRRPFTTMNDLLLHLEAMLHFERIPDIVNMSFGSSHRRIGKIAAFEKLAARLAARGTILIAAAGNGRSDERTWPAACKNVIAVGALAEPHPTADSQHVAAPFSAYGRWVNVWAHGENVRADYLNGRFSFAALGSPSYRFEGAATWSGTSFASAIASGLIADQLVRQRELDGPEVTAKECLAGLKTGTVAVGSQRDDRHPQLAFSLQ